jgi:signal transduction histidine kinase/ActR/RegA family two-component response regulator
MNYQDFTPLPEPDQRDTRQRETILAAVSFAAEKFLKSDSWEQPIDDVLARLGEAAAVSRAYIFENFIQEDGLMAARIRYEWVSPEIAPQINSPELQNFTYETYGFSRWLVEMSQGNVIVGPVASFSPGEQAVLSGQSIISLLAVPILVGAEWWGFIGFDDCISARDWSAAETESLRAAANILGAAIQRMAAEEALRHSQAVNHTLLQSLPDALFHIGANRRLLDVHGQDGIVNYLRRHQALGLRLEEALLILPDFLQPVSRRFMPFIDQVLATGEPVSFEYRVTNNDRLTHFETRIIPGPVGTVLVLVRDLTEQKQAEEMLREAQKAESVRVLAGGIAHDFNNLLTGLMVQASLARVKLAPDDVTQVHIDKILKISQRAADLTHQLLTYAGKAQARIETLDLNELIAQNASILETILPRHSLYLDLSVEPMIVTGDQGQLQQVIMNLIINAAEAIEGRNGRVIIKTWPIIIDAETDQQFYGGAALTVGSYVCLQIIDEGTGMDKATLSRIFDPFFSTKPHGRGLGLSATLGIVRSQNGALQVDSQPGRGTTFTVWLPTSAEAQEDSKNQPLEPDPETTGLILLVDDEAPVREAVVDILQTLGLQVITAANGQEGLALFKQYREEITAVLLDMQMPVMGGKETLQAIRQLDQIVPVILSSGYSEAELSEQLQDEATTFLQKPYNMDRLIEIVTAAIVGGQRRKNGG